MNKQRYLAELQRLLVFMTDEDRAETIRRYGEMFDEAGAGNEAELIEEIGSPTKAAIILSRGYEPGGLDKTLPGPPKEKAALTQTQDDPWGDLPTFDMPEHIEEMIAEEEEAEAPEEAGGFTMPDLPVYSAEKPREGIKDESGIPLWLGIPLFVIVLLGLGIPLAAVVIGLMAGLAAPGCGVIFGAYLVAVGGLWCVGFMADAILLFGAAFIVFAFGIILLFAGIWLDVKLCSLYISGLRWVAGELIGRRSAVYE